MRARLSDEKDQRLQFPPAKTVQPPAPTAARSILTGEAASPTARDRARPASGSGGCDAAGRTSPQLAVRQASRLQATTRHRDFDAGCRRSPPPKARRHRGKSKKENPSPSGPYARARLSDEKDQRLQFPPAKTVQPPAPTAARSILTGEAASPHRPRSGAPRQRVRRVRRCGPHITAVSIREASRPSD